MQSEVEEQRSLVRMLGAVLGDVIREQDGEDVFRQIEDIRRASVSRHWQASEASAQELSELLRKLSVAETVRFVHSFACFLQITNIAEDHIQRRRGRAGDSRPDTLANVVGTLEQQGVSREAVQTLLAGGLMAPVITAHPSEARRKSVLDHQHAIGRALERLEQAQSEAERRRIDTDIRQQVSILWRTRLLRNVRIAVEDEIENAASYFEDSFLAAVPALYAHCRDVLGET